MQPHSEVRRRRRRVLSCMACRRRKIKCNREHPCQHCTETQQACNYQAPPSPQLWQASKEIEAERPRANNWRSVIFSSGSNTPESFGDGGPVHHEAPPVPPTLLQSPPSSQPFPAAPSNTHATPESHPPSFVSHLPRRDERIFARKSAALDSQMVLDKTRILRWSHWMGAGQEVCCTSITSAHLACSKTDAILRSLALFSLATWKPWARGKTLTCLRTPRQCSATRPRCCKSASGLRAPPRSGGPAGSLASRDTT